MGPDTYAVAQADQLLSLPGFSMAEIQRELLAEFLRNPFLDDDLQGLALRTGLQRDELLEGLEVLVEVGLLKDAGRRGFMLDLERLDPEVENADKVLVLPGGAPGDEERNTGILGLVDWLPFGVALLHPEGSQITANSKIGQLLGLAADEINAEALAARTGCDPGLVCAAGTATTFPLEDGALEVQVHPCEYAGKRAVLVIVQDQSLQDEIAQVHVQIQEELFGQLRSEVAEPLKLIRAYLENPDAANLGTSRAALEQIDVFLQSFFLQVRSKNGSV